MHRTCAPHPRTWRAWCTAHSDQFAPGAPDALDAPVHGHTVHQAHARQRPRCDRARASTTADGGGERLVSRRIEERTPGTHRVRASLRALDVRGIRALRPRLLPAAAAGRRTAQRIDQSRSHQLLGSRADRRARARAVDGVRSHGLPAPGADQGEIREPARRGAERAAPELRESPVRPGRHGNLRRALCSRSPVSLADDRIGRGPPRLVARRGARLLLDLLPPGQRIADAGRRHRRRARPGAGRGLLRRICRQDSGPLRYGPMRSSPPASGSSSKIASSCRACISRGTRRRCLPTKTRSSISPPT